MSKPFTAGELLSALKVERDRSDDECVRLGEAAEAMVKESLRMEQMENAELGKARDRLLAELEQAKAENNTLREQADLYRRSIELLTADGERAEQEERAELREFARLLLIECRQRGCHSPRFEQVARDLHIEPMETRP